MDYILLGQSRFSERGFEVRKNLNLVTAGPRLQEIEQLNVGDPHSGELLKTAFNQAVSDQDFIFIDCPLRREFWSQTHSSLPMIC